MIMSLQSSFLNFSVGLGAVIYKCDCKLNGRLSSNVDGHVDNYLLMLCSMPLTIIVRRSLGGYEFGLEIESVQGKFEKTIYNDI